MQLPAVTAQTEEESQIKSEQLKQNGFQHLSTSYFERMLQNCIDKNGIMHLKCSNIRDECIRIL